MDKIHFGLKSKIKKILTTSTLESITKYNIAIQNLSPCFISWFPIINSTGIEYDHYKRKEVQRTGYDVDNYYGHTKMIQDCIKDLKIFSGDGEKHIKATFTQRHTKADIKTNGYVIVIEQDLNNNDVPDLKLHRKMCDTLIKELIKENKNEK